MALHKIYTKKIAIPANVKIEKKQNNLLISGLLGSTQLDLKKLDPIGVGAIYISSNHTTDKRSLERQIKFVSKRETNEVCLENSKKENIVCFMDEVNVKKSLKKSNDSLNTKYIIFCTSSKPFFGLFSSIIVNKIHGVTRGFLTYIRIIGVGYRAMLENQTLQFKLGFSHDIKFKLPCSVRAFLLEPTLICLYGIDKNQVTQIAAKIRQIKPPSVYKGKGIRLTHETIFTKTGKRK